MATITSSSTNTQISAAYLDNCGWYEDGNVTMAKAFITVCIAMLSRGIISVNSGDDSMTFSPRDLREMMNDARQFVSRNDTTNLPSVIHPNLTELRS